MKARIAFLLLVPLALAACASAPIVREEAAPGATIAMNAGNFTYDPNMVTVHGTGTVTLTVTNVSGSGHNIVVNDPRGKEIARADLPPKGTATVQVTFPAPGDYYFFCSHPFHAGFGMKGHFIVTGS